MSDTTELVADGLRIRVSEPSAGGMRLDWTGRSTDAHPDRFLAPFLASVAEQALRGAGVIELHFERIEYFNSATITALIHFIRLARERHLGLVVSFAAATRWQSISFEALRVFERPDGLLRFCAVG